MKVLLSIHHLPVHNAGAPGVTLRLASELAKLGHATGVLSLADMGITAESIPAYLKYPWFLASRLRGVQDCYDVLDLSSADGWVYERKRGDAGPLVVTRSHGLEHLAHAARLQAAARGELKLSWKYPFYHGGYRLWEVAQSFRRADMSFFLNREELRYAVDHLGVDESRTRIIDNGIGDGFLALPFPVRNASKGLRIVLVGSYTHRKVHGVPQVLDRLLSRHPDWSVAFLGTGIEDEKVLASFRPEVQGRVTAMRSYDNDNLPNLLLDYDIMLFPSLFEGSPIAPFEAMACGVALVASSLAPLAERLLDGKEAVLVPTGDIAAVERALEMLNKDRSWLASLQQGGHRRAQHFSWSRIAATTVAFYEEGLALKRSAK